MKKIVLLLLILIPVFAFSQGGFWGFLSGTAELRWDTTFVDTDSTKLSGHTLTAIDSADYVYTDVVDPKDDDEVGIYWIDVDFDSITGIGEVDSCQLWVRFYLDKNIHPNRPFTVWYNIGGFMKSDTLYNFDLADSTWNRPSKGKQYRSTVIDKVVGSSVGLPGVGQYTN